MANWNVGGSAVYGIKQDGEEDFSNVSLQSIVRLGGGDTCNIVNPVDLIHIGKTYSNGFINQTKPKIICKFGKYFLGTWGNIAGDGSVHLNFALYNYDNGLYTVKEMIGGFSHNTGGGAEEQYCWICSLVNPLSGQSIISIIEWVYLLETNGVNQWNINDNLPLSNTRIKWLPINTLGEADLDKSEDTSGEGGGKGNLDTSSDNIPWNDAPSLDLQSTGFLTMYAPTSSELASLSSFLWSSDLVDTIKKMWDSPMENIISLMAVPLTPSTSGSAPVKIGGVETGVSMNLLTNQFFMLNCGSIDIKEYYGNALDYNPYTKLSIFLPFVGIVPLSSDDAMDGKIEVRYLIDLLSCEGVAQIKITRADYEGVTHHYKCNVGYRIPLSMRDYSGMYQSIVGGTLAVGSAVALGGGVATGGALVSATSNAVNSSKVNTQRSGGISANSGILDILYPYLIIERPVQSLANNYKKFNGYPSNITSKLKNLSGFTIVDRIIGDGLSCHEDEKELIYNQLKQGIIL